MSARYPLLSSNKKHFATLSTALTAHHGLNLTQHNYLPLHGTLQTPTTKCSEKLEDIFLLPSFDRAVNVNREQKDYGHGLGMQEYKFRYYVDLKNNYVYFFDLVDSQGNLRYTTGRFCKKESVGINQNDIDGIFTGRTVISRIYEDNLTEKKVMSFFNTGLLCR